MKKFFIIKVLVVIIFLVASYMICDYTKYYIPNETYEKDELRVVIDMKDVTKKLPDKAIIKDNVPYLSFDTIKMLFDKYIYFDEKYDTIIVTNETNILKMKIDDNMAYLNGTPKQIMNTAYKSSNTVYIPIKELEEMYLVSVTDNEKIIIETQNANYSHVKVSEKGKVKLHRQLLSLTMGTFEKDDILTVFPESEDGEYVKVRNTVGDLGYVKADVISNGTLVSNNEIIAEEKPINKKINLTWEYAENYTPNRNGEAKITGLNTISPTWFYMQDETGEVRTTIDANYVKWAKSVGYSLWPAIKNDSMGRDKTSMLVTDMNAREKFINNILEIAQTYDLEGINIDFEYMYQQDKDAFTELVREFSATFRRNNIIVSADVIAPDDGSSWSVCYDRTAIADSVDYIILMGYDQFGAKQFGPVASLSWVNNSLKKMIQKENVEPQKLILAVPFYSKYCKDKVVKSGDEEVLEAISRQSPSMGSAKEIMNYSRLKNSVTWDETMGQYVVSYRTGDILESAWIEDEKALAEKAKLVDEYGLAGIASWRRGFETSEAWKIIKNNVNGL